MYYCAAIPNFTRRLGITGRVVTKFAVSADAWIMGRLISKP